MPHPGKFVSDHFHRAIGAGVVHNRYPEIELAVVFDQRSEAASQLSRGVPVDNNYGNRRIHSMEIPA